MAQEKQWGRPDEKLELGAKNIELDEWTPLQLSLIDRSLVSSSKMGGWNARMSCEMTAWKTLLNPNLMTNNTKEKQCTRKEETVGPI